MHSSNQPLPPDDVERLIQRYGPALRSFFGRRTATPTDAEDLLQEVALRLARHDDFGSVQNVEGYVFTIASNILRDRKRRARTRPQEEPISPEYVEESAFSPERVLLGRQALDHLSLSLNDLPERTRTIFILCRIEGVAYQTVAAQLGISLSSVNKHMARAMDRLMQEMQDFL